MLRFLCLFVIVVSGSCDAESDGMGEILTDVIPDANPLPSECEAFWSRYDGQVYSCEALRNRVPEGTSLCGSGGTVVQIGGREWTDGVSGLISVREHFTDPEVTVAFLISRDTAVSSNEHNFLHCGYFREQLGAQGPSTPLLLREPYGVELADDRPFPVTYVFNPAGVLEETVRGGFSVDDIAGLIGR